jgi:glycosyl transferase family 25
MATTNVVDATYVINMDADTHRLQVFDTVMANLQWPYQRFPAINGRTLTDTHLKSTYVQKLTWLAPSEVGCLLSHVSLWKKVATDPSLNRIAIFEDDARTHMEGDGVLRLVTDFYSHLQTNKIAEPDMLYLGKSLDDCMSYQKVWHNVYTSTHPQCLHAYIINKRGAQQLLSMAPYFEAIDMVPIKAIEAGKIRVMAFHPSIFFQDVFGTTSNLRSLASAINNTCECRVSQQYIGGDTWAYIIVVIIALIAAIILFVWFLWR